MNTTPKISIIVPIYNVERYLPKCLDSLVNQAMSDIEIICVNDGSTDGSLDVLNDYASRDKRIVIINQDNAGVSIARNNALACVKGEYYMFVDSDDWLDLVTCEEAYKVITENEADCLMFSYTKEFGNHKIINHIFEEDFILWEGETVKEKFHRRLFGPVGNELSQPQNMDIIVSPCMQLFKTSKFAGVRFVDIREVGTFEDGLYQMVIYNDCNRFVYIDQPYYHYLKTNEASITTRYKADLYEKWQHLYDIINEYISTWELGKDYMTAYRNRIAIGILGLGLNQAHSKDNIFHGGRHLGEMLSKKRYKEAIASLDISLMPISWKCFFFLAKHKMTTSLFAMLKTIEYLRTHKK